MTWIKCYRHGLGGDLAFRFVDDSPLEEDGFEPSVPPEKRTHLVEMFDRSSTSLPRGTEGSNPSSSGAWMSSMKNGKTTRLKGLNVANRRFTDCPARG